MINKISANFLRNENLAGLVTRNFNKIFQRVNNYNLYVTCHGIKVRLNFLASEKLKFSSN